MQRDIRIITRYVQNLKEGHFDYFMKLYNNEMKTKYNLEDRFLHTDIKDIDEFIRTIKGVLTIFALKRMSSIISTPYENMPLYINDNMTVISVTARWRMKVGM